MANKVKCSRCDQEREGLDGPPMGGAGGQKVLERVCRECWQEWREMSAQLIAHYGLVLGNPAHRQQMRMAMSDFLNLGEE